MKHARRYIAGLMALVICVTSGVMAAARGQAYDAAGAVILCTGHGAVLVYVDHEGQPVEAPHLCPDCTLALLTPKPASAPGRILTRSDSPAVWPRVASAASAPRLGPLQARAPPACL